MTQIAVTRRPDNHQTQAATHAPPTRSRESCPRAMLEAIYQRERPRLAAYLEYRVGKEEAKDLVHEVFLKAATSERLTELRNPCCFLFRIARNLLIDEARKRDRRISMLPLFEGCEMAKAADQEEDLQATQTAEVLQRAIDELPEKTATIFAMNRIEGKSYRQIHEERGIALATVDYHMMKALKHLRERLADHR